MMEWRYGEGDGDIRRSASVLAFVLGVARKQIRRLVTRRKEENRSVFQCFWMLRF